MSNLKLFDDDTSPEDNSLIERRIDGQWVYTVALREAASIAYRRPITYSQVLAMADKLAPEILGRQELLFRPGESNLTRFYREKAALLTAKQQRETGSTEVQVKPIDVVDKEIKDLEELLRSDNGRSRMQREQLEKLRGVRKEFEEQEFVPRDEHEIILKDWKRGTDLPTFFPQDAHNYHDFALPSDRIMRIRLLHPQKAETITGVDLIYEHHRPEDKIARLAAVQYKIPQGNSKNIIIDEKIQRQLNRIRSTFCGSELCVGPSYDGKPVDNRSYQLPCCCAFFRPTERLQQFNSRLSTTGYHIRICDIDRVCQYTGTGNKILTSEISMKYGISHTVFEELFNTDRLGSRWLTYEQLEKFHHEYEIIKPHEQAGIYIQEALMPTLRWR